MCILGYTEDMTHTRTHTHETLGSILECELEPCATLLAPLPHPVPGDRFGTEFESGCVATTAPDENGDFLALDSDGVECLFHVSMVTDYA